MPTKDELYDLASAHQIEGRSSMSKAELIRAIEDAGGSIPEDDDVAADEASSGASHDDDVQPATGLRDIYTSYTESVLATQYRHAGNYDAIVERFGEQLSALERDASRANPLPVYLKEVSDAYYARDAALLNDANTKLAKHLQEMSGMIEHRYTEAMRKLVDEITELYKRSRDEYVSQATSYAEAVQATWKSTPTADADTSSLGVLQHGLLVGAAARSLDALGGSHAHGITTTEPRP